ncbi:uncharacterized protein LOC125568409 [Nematostella vectensis]|uniref:uncharacterized protein LOC125568409 n=1 Tax=Nematostella vectensis TaxID=45351 RepID=UPI0020774FFA|nr:uncharacterized protein LOC125568409 [Nematostella vectensis]
MSTDDDSSTASSSAYKPSSQSDTNEFEPGAGPSNQIESDSESEENGYAGEPLADPEWLLTHETKQEQKREMEEDLNKRLTKARDGEWCKYENCNTEFVRNINECYCCTELEGCVEALQSDLVVQDLEPCTKLKCVTEHPGFAPVCLEKWSLRMAAKKLRRRDKETYKQTGTEERLLRALAYREFTRLIYGIMGRKIIPLPACAYHAIRRTFPMAEDDDGAGFELRDD